MQALPQVPCKVSSVMSRTSAEQRSKANIARGATSAGHQWSRAPLRFSTVANTGKARSIMRQKAGRLVVRAGDYVPSPMDTSMLTAQLEVLGAVGVMVVYWWYVLVPNARVNLAVNKKKGNLRAYLQDLKEDDSRGLERWFYSNWLEKIDPETKFLLRDEDKPSPVQPAGREYKVEETVQEIVKNAKKAPKFWSWDNPVLVGTAVTIGISALGSGFRALMNVV
mmetsp:Transcript_43700/g.83407  ORF Transcript_43700/g.83407 Transcript_43700/m.83407 type:complete len:223 (+) Transcript_43700:104-772(+)